MNPPSSSPARVAGTTRVGPAVLGRVGWVPVSADPRVASARIRCLNPIRTLQGRGVPIEVFDAARVDEYDLVVFSKRYDRRARRDAADLRARGATVVFDLCDNHFYNPDGDPGLADAAGALREMVALADAVVCSTDALAGVVQAECNVTDVTVIGDAVEAEVEAGRVGAASRAWARWRLARLRSALARTPGDARLVWFGIAAGSRGEYGMRDLARCRAAIERVARDVPLSLTVISNSRELYRSHVQGWPVPTHYLEWHADTFTDALREHAVALVPVTPTPFTVCKTNNRVATALANGLGVVADEIPSYRPFASACRLDDWETGIREYVTDRAARARDVAQGRGILARDWSPGAVADRWQEFFARRLHG